MTFHAAPEGNGEGAFHGPLVDLTVAHSGTFIASRLRQTAGVLRFFFYIRYGSTENGISYFKTTQVVVIFFLPFANASRVHL